MKVFGVGWAKTGTTTLGQCFETLGLSHKGQDLNLVGRLDVALILAGLYDSFEDWPWILYYKELDEQYPRSKFVLTTRDSQRWIKSYRNMLSKERPLPSLAAVRTEIYGLPFPDVTDEQLVERYERHNADVMKHFSGRLGDLLVVNWEDGDGWTRLCHFLEMDVPEKPFPHANKGSYKS